jgi:restriction endonuclease S subunit
MTETGAPVSEGRWPTHPLKSVVERISVGVPTSRYAARSGSASISVPVLSVGDIEDGRLPPVEEIPKIELRSVDQERFRVRPGDVLLSCRGTVLKSAPVLEDMGGTLASSNLITIRPILSVMLPQLILSLLRSSAWQEALRSRTRSSTGLMQLTVKDVEDLLVPVPPRELQAKLAALVDEGDRAYRTAMAAATTRQTLVESIVTRALLDPAPEKIR